MVCIRRHNAVNANVLGAVIKIGAGHLCLNTRFDMHVMYKCILYTVHYKIISVCGLGLLLLFCTSVHVCAYRLPSNVIAIECECWLLFILQKLFGLKDSKTAMTHTNTVSSQHLSV